MKVVIGFLVGIVCLLGGCVPKPPAMPSVEKAPGAPPAVEFGRTCSLSEAEAWQAEGAVDPAAAFIGAACWTSLAEKEEQGSAARLTAIRQGRELASSAVAAWPESGLAHYLLAYLTGLTAEETPLKGLELVPVIEREAQQAARLQPDIDHGGPDRMLGELYLRAPGFPVSIGDPALAAEHFRRAVDLAPGHAGNRLGLIEALLAEGETGGACSELSELFQQSFSAQGEDAQWQKALELQRRLCGQVD